MAAPTLTQEQIARLLSLIPEQAVQISKAPVEVKTAKTEKFLKQISDLKNFSKVQTQNVPSFLKFKEEVDNWFEFAGVSQEVIAFLLTEDHYVLCETLDSNLKYIVLSQVDDIVRHSLKKLVPTDKASTGLQDFRNLHAVFQVNKITEVVKYASICLRVLAKKDLKDFDKNHDLFVKAVDRASRILSTLSEEDLRKVVTAIFATSLPNLSQDVNIQLGLSAKQTHSEFLNVLSTAARGAALVLEKQSDGDLNNDYPDKRPRFEITHYCSHCGKANHSEDVCRSKIQRLQPAQIPKALHDLRKNARDGMIPLAQVKEVLKINSAPSSLTVLVTNVEPVQIEVKENAKHVPKNKAQSVTSASKFNYSFVDIFTSDE